MVVKSESGGRWRTCPEWSEGNPPPATKGNSGLADFSVSPSFFTQLVLNLFTPYFRGSNMKNKVRTKEQNLSEREKIRQRITEL